MSAIRSSEVPLGSTWGATCSQSCVFFATFCQQEHFQNSFGSLFPYISHKLSYFCSQQCVYLIGFMWLKKVYLFPRELINVLLPNYRECSTSYWCGGGNVNLNWTSILKIWSNFIPTAEVLTFSMVSLCHGIFTTCD